MSYRIQLSKRVRKQLDSLPSSVFERVDVHITALRDDPRPNGAKKLKGFQRMYRVRVGEYRIVYELDDTAQEVRLVDVDHRKDVYR
jgi:mRNA interferase RelE/StbE